MSFLDKLLELGSTPDWITPLGAMIQDLTNGPYHRIYVHREAGYSVNDIVRLLKQAQIKSWGDDIVDDMIVVTVEKTKAKFAHYILHKAGVNTLNGAE